MEMDIFLVVTKRSRPTSILPSEPMMSSLLVTSFLFASIICITSGFQGDLTYYDPEVGLTACGTFHRSSEFIAALSFTDFINTPNPNNSPSCNMCALIRGSTGASALVRIKDKCAGCRSGDIDVTPTVFRLFAPLSVGRLRVSWEFVPCSTTPTGSSPSGTSNYCGSSYMDSKSCRQSCPNGVDSECPAGQRCFASVSCTSGSSSSGSGSSSTSNYCGTSYVDSKSCRQTCPNGVDRECLPGQRCFASVPC